MKKKVFAILTAILLLCAALPLGALSVSADDETIIRVVDGEAEYRWCPRNASDTVVVPATYEGCPVTKIDSFAFNGCTSVTEVVLPSSIKVIEESAFFGCKNLTSVNIPDGVTTIGRSAFANCFSLSSAPIPASLTSLGASAFQGTDLTSVTIPSGVKEIPACCFSGCDYLASVTLPKGLTSIGEHAFAFAFQNWGPENSINIPSTVTSIGAYAFYNCKFVSGMTLPAGIKSIPEYAFSGCWSLSADTFVIPDGVTSIGDGAFQECCGIDKMVIPKSVTSIGDSVFEGYEAHTVSLTILYAGSEQDWKKVTIGKNNENMADFPIYYNGQKPTKPTEPKPTEPKPTEPTKPTQPVEPEDPDEPDEPIQPNQTEEPAITVIITRPQPTIIIGGGLPDDGNDSFDNVVDEPFDDEGLDFSCELAWGEVTLTGLQKEFAGEVVIPDTINGYPVTGIGEGLFEDCTAITSVVVPDGIYSIGENAFKGCTNLTSVYLPVGLSFISSGAFADCDALTDVYYAGSEEDLQYLWMNDNDLLLNAMWHYNSKFVNQDAADTDKAEDKDKADKSDDADGGNVVVWIVIGAVVVIAAGVTLFLILRKKKEN